MVSVIPGGHRWIWATVLLAGLVGVGSGCGEEEAPPPAEAKPAEEKPAEAAPKAEAAAATPAPAAASAATEEEGLTYSYNPIGKRDPFRSFISKDPVPTESRPETPLQKYEIDQYKLVGVVWGVPQPLALVEDPEKMGYFLQKDTLIGKNSGKVVRITPTEVIVAEEYRDFEGKLIVNEIPLKLPTEEEKR